MIDYKKIKKNCLQWGLRVLPPRIYHNILLCYADWASSDSYRRIYQAHFDDNCGFWGWKFLPCEIELEGDIFNIATGRHVNANDEEIIASFTTWSDYEDFREDIRDATSRHLEKGIGPEG